MYRALPSVAPAPGPGGGAGGGFPGAPSRTAAPAAPRAEARKKALDRNGLSLPADPAAEPADAAAKMPAKDAVSKLAVELQGLAAKVAQDGKDGNLTVGRIEVKNGRVEVRVQLANLSDETLAQLKEIGLKILAQAKTAKLVIGSIDVTKLEELAKLDVVVRVEPSS